MSLRLRFALLAIASLLLLQFAAAQSDPFSCAENCRFVVVPSLGPAGPQGESGPQGLPGINGTNGINGLNGKDGIDGTNGINGLNGKDGINGTNGINGINGVWNDYEYFKVDNVPVKAGIGGSQFTIFSCTFVRVGRHVTLHYSKTWANGMPVSAHDKILVVVMSEAQFPLRFRPPTPITDYYGYPFYFVPVISQGVTTLGSMRVDKDGMLTFWGGMPGATFQQSSSTVGWEESSISWTV